MEDGKSLRIKKIRKQIQRHGDGRIHVTPLHSVDMGVSSSELLQLLNCFSIIKFTIKFIIKACLLTVSSAVLSRGFPHSADPRGCLEKSGG